MVVTGFEPADLLFGIYKCVSQLEQGIACLENAYKRVVPEKGNPIARKLMEEMLEPVDREWRGIGQIPSSGFALREKYAAYDAAVKFTPLPQPLSTRRGEQDCEPLGTNPAENQLPSLAGRDRGRGQCIAGEIMKGNLQVADCPYFGTVCSPDHPLGAPMVSAEGVCAAYYNYQ